MDPDEIYEVEDFVEDAADVDEEAAADFLRAADAGDIAVLQQMANRSELLDAQDEMGNTALHLAALNAHVRYDKSYPFD
jgi:ankyrin repeat protein